MRTLLAKSVLGRDVLMYSNTALPSLGNKLEPYAPLTLLIGGTHGDEEATVAILENFIAAYLATGKIVGPTAIISVLNPDGYAAKSRYNARGVDLNRNFPHRWSPTSLEAPGSAPLSEPESRALHDFILTHRPAKIISLHWALAEIDADGPQSTGLAKAMWNSLKPSERLPYRLRIQEEGVDGGNDRLPSRKVGGEEFCSGSLGQWCGHGLVYPGQRPPAIVTLELPYHPHFSPRPVELPEDHLETVRHYWTSAPGDYLQGVEGPVHRMLEAACRFQINTEY